MPRVYTPIPAHERVLARSVQDGDCLVWTGTVNNAGYGTVGVPQGEPGHRKVVPRLVHRVVYEALVGPIPDGLVIDHLCATRRCVRVDHLEAVTPAENSRRGEPRNSLLVHRRTRETCQNGHPWTPENTIVRADTSRKCRICWLDYMTAYNRRRRS